VIRSPDAEKGGETSVRLWSPPPTDPVRSPRERAKRAWSTRTASWPAERFGDSGSAPFGRVARVTLGATTRTRARPIYSRVSRLEDVLESDPRRAKPRSRRFRARGSSC